MAVLNLIRWKNLLMIAIVQLLLKYALFEPFNVDITLSWFGFGLLILATLCIAAAGNIINDINDVAIDKVNKPSKVIIGKKISEKTAYNLFVVFNVIGVGIGFYLSNVINKSVFATLFILISALLFLRSTPAPWSCAYKCFLSRSTTFRSSSADFLAVSAAVKVV